MSKKSPTDVSIRVTKEFYLFLQVYMRDQGFNSVSSACAAITQKGLDTLRRDYPMVDDIEVSPGKWGGHRHGQERQSGPLYFTRTPPVDPLELDTSYADDLNPGIEE